MAKQVSGVLSVAAPNFQTMRIKIRGTSPYCQHKFSAKIKEELRAKQAAGDVAKANKKRGAKDFDACYEQAQYRDAKEGWNGIPAACFRSAMISACRAAGIVMTRTKLAVFVEPDGFDADNGDPIIKITKGKPRKIESILRNETGVIDLRARPLWDVGWEAWLRIRHDADMISQDAVANLLLRAGQQVGIGEGRPDSRKCAGIGWGLFVIAND